ncbi:DEAD/DEAH box helicase [Ralstonia pseudosolanacearum]|uniref:DEAD/DEAH box helicase n=1 Tax=Ralstonia pseudosolanacearum TaxID=1310165 RepID=UPI00048CC153|nr:DEAD/DEAH box helicase family protein [Ralstonia pseudosolanacearum]MDO3558664.1 DEAD/DEAH box helicase family protein [Ralstonia pseudosolanacearum]MDO3575118.1 DEAD/DEAH box helicase family protein [Ralstonia pseudosolanacearum]MDO3585002.1 DEAD/DEAH box helicase family protein [Ralstonia pseudosolanacearum]
MSERIDGSRAAQQIAARLSLRAPQRESLDILADLLEKLELGKDADLQHWLQTIRAQYPTVEKFERDFPTLCFALATGVGKTRLMGAIIAWLFITGRSRHFFVLAPNLTIYEKLKQDFLPGSPKYVFKGIPELANNPPVLISGEDYEDGRGVRLDIAIPQNVTGELFTDDTAPHINIFNISKINARDNKKGAAKSSMARVRRYQEYLGESYFDYLAGLPDLVVLMDEAHRYYASAGAKAINDLKPVLGIELTATPKTVGANSRQFANIVYHYPLSRALQDGYVKMPAVATRKDFRADSVSSERLEEIKLEDGIHHHEFVKVELENYARSFDKPVVKPFMLVVAQDTAHASALKAVIESDGFFQGHYKGRVIEVHSNLSGDESDEAMQRLLAVEHDEKTEVVIHVNKLKEGWDVTNLYTIVPLRASASEILTEQTIGRGLRLPFGKRTGVEAVDRLCIIAHDRFQDIVDRANDPESIIKKTVYIGATDDADVPDKQPQLLNTGSVLDILCTGRQPEQDGKTLADSIVGGTAAPTVTQEESRLAELTLRAVQQEAARLPASKALSDEAVQQRLVATVKRWAEETASPQASLPGVEPVTPTSPDVLVAQVVRHVTERLIELTIDVPQITILPTREVNYRFQEFSLTGLEKINFQPIDQELLLQHLEDNKQARIQWEGSENQEARPEDYIVRQLIDQDAIDYDEHADLLYTLAGQLVDRLREHLGHDETKLENVLIYWQRQLADFIWAQMQQNVWITPTDYIGKVTQGFDVLRPASFTLAAGEIPRDFRAPIADKRLIRHMVFKGFKRCCYPFQKFQSVEGEWRLAQILEDDPNVLKWMKPAPGQFRIEYKNGRNYEPDFVVETNDACLLIEPKRADQLEQDDVKDKARAAVRWCGYASQHASENGGKPWYYLMIPDTAIQLGRSVAAMQAEFMRSD